MSLFVDTSVWSLAFRRDSPASAKQVQALIQAIERGETILTTGLVVQFVARGSRDRSTQDAAVAVSPLIPDANVEQRRTGADVFDIDRSRSGRELAGPRCGRATR
ncbi:MAG: hypothetical protein L6R19_15445 [Alphaproteobacteria bacterium]|nr:hypothetical protein [Alphaproteobacteria bacterium]